MILTGYVKRIFVYGIPVFLFPSFIVVSAFETKSMAFSFDQFFNLDFCLVDIL